MALRSPTMFATAFLTLAFAYTLVVNIAIRVDADAAMYRFEDLIEMGAERRASAHGERLLKLKTRDGADPIALAPIKVALAQTYLARREFDLASIMINDALATDWAQTLEKREHIALEDQLARTAIHRKDYTSAVSIYASFVELSGDVVTHATETNENSIQRYYAQRIADAADTFAASINYASATPIPGVSTTARLAAANHMATIGGHYSLMEGANHAAAGLLAVAYETRKKILGADHQDTVQVVLSLGPVLTGLGRYKDAETLYLNAFHAQERVKGSSDPGLSLYIKLLGSVYELQGRNTEAQALYDHMRAIFRDAFGEQRYSTNKGLDPETIINRPVSQFYPLAKTYLPRDLVSAAAYSIPTSKSPSIDEMRLRLAPDEGDDPREANMPVRLAQLISLCRSESGERISLRSGYRSYNTQHVLHQRNGTRGTVAPAGMSEHQTGLAADIDVGGRFMRQSDSAYQCFEENAFRYGFILSYPPNNNYLPGPETHEPWHWRYVGAQTAQLYREAGPYRKPQEFLASLPCYQERAAKGLFPIAGSEDLCLTSAQENSQAATIQKTVETADHNTPNHSDTPSASELDSATAQILNQKIQSQQSQ